MRLHQRALSLSTRSHSARCAMRIVFLFLVIAAAGCHTCGPDAACAPDAGGCEHCRGGAGMGCDRCLGGCCFGRHAKYCRCWDGLLTRREARWRAQKDLRKLDHHQPISCDFRLGYEQAYVDVALGACGEVPPLPPANYWKASARTPEGHAKAQQWFAGYAAGVEPAKAIYEPFNRVATSEGAGYGWNGCPPSGMPIGPGP